MYLNGINVADEAQKGDVFSKVGRNKNPPFLPLPQFLPLLSVYLYLPLSLSIVSVSATIPS